MKTILVLTDFSKNSAHAAKSAARLAEKLHAKLLLWNCYPKVPIMPVYLGGTLLATAITGAEGSIDKLNKARVALEDFIISTDGDYKPELLIKCAEGPFEKELSKLLRSEVFELLVMGISLSCFVNHLFVGSDTYKVIETANCPVLIVPRRAGIELLDKVVFATDFEPEDVHAIRYLYHMSEDINFKLEIVHVIHDGEINEALASREANFKAKLAAHKFVDISYRQVKGKEVVNRLNRITTETKADMMAMTHRQYAFLIRLLIDSVAKKELAHQKVPLLLFPVDDKAL